MKRVLKSKVYDTEKAEALHSYDYGMAGDFGAIEETLYRTQKGAFFIAGSGGPLTQYAVQVETNTTSGSSRITAVNRAEAIEWLEEKGGHNVLVEYFSEDLEEA